LLDRVAVQLTMVVAGQRPRGEGLSRHAQSPSCPDAAVLQVLVAMVTNAKMLTNARSIQFVNAMAVHREAELNLDVSLRLWSWQLLQALAWLLTFSTNTDSGLTWTQRSWQSCPNTCPWTTNLPTKLTKLKGDRYVEGPRTYNKENKLHVRRKLWRMRMANG
ncbi:hypothetical protein CRG98_010358, partial [Punica granatum]